MATYKGITIQFRGETTELDAAIKHINRETKSLNQELKSVDRALKFNPTSVDLWRQKQTLLNEKIDATDEKLQSLKRAQDKMDADGIDKNSEEYRKLQREIIETESQLKTFKKQLKFIGNVNLRAASEQFKELGSKLESAGQQMKGLSMAAAGMVASMGALAYKSGAWADDINTMSKVYGIGTQELQKYAASAALVDVDLETITKSHVKLTKAIDGAKEGTGANAEAFEQLGVAIKDADGNLRSADEVWNDTIKALGQVTDETERDALAMQLMGKSAMELNPLIEDGGQTYEEMAKTMAKYNLEFIDDETLAKANEFNDSIDTIKAIGGLALQELGTKLSAYLAPALEKVVDWVGRLAEWLAGLDPEVLAIIGGIAGVIAVVAPLLIGLGKLSFAISSIMSLMATIGPVIGGIISAAAPFVLIIGAIVAAGVLLYKNWDTIKAKAIALWNKIKEIFGAIKEFIVGIWEGIKTTVSDAWNGIKETVSTVGEGIKAKASEIWEGMKSNASAAWSNIKTTVGGAWDAMRARASQNWELMKTGAAKAWEFMKTNALNSNTGILGVVRNNWDKIKDAISKPIERAKELIKAAWDKIKSILSGNLSFPKIKLPHFKITGKFSLNPPSVPTLGVDWYKTGGIFNSPSIIGVGEAGSEAVVPLDKLWSKLDKIAAGAGGDTIINVYGSDNMSVRDLANEVKRIIIEEENRRRLAWQ